VLSVASECFPLVKTGGLADVVGALPLALAPFGVVMRVLLPRYRGLALGLEQVTEVLRLADLPGGEGRILAARHERLGELFLLDMPQLFDRPGGPYQDPSGRDYADNALRFAALGAAAAHLARAGGAGFRPEIVHAHDWQAGLALAYLALHPGARPKTVFTIHNLAYQGRFEASWLAALKLPEASFRIDGVEYYGGIGFLKAGLYYADRITTVSPTYAREITTPAMGMGLDGLLRARAADLTGILNGIDLSLWDPARDRFLAEPYDVRTLAARAENRRQLERRFRLDADPAAPLFAAIGRLAHQKGFDLLLAGLDRLVARGGRLVLLASGDAALEAAFEAAVQRHRGRIGCIFAYDEELAHQIYGGADALVVPSRFEPCGLVQLCALHYGCLPVVARTGGLADTVVDASPMALARKAATGIQFPPGDEWGLEIGLQRALELWRRPELWRQMQEVAMAEPVGWDQAAAAYAALYRELLALS
jgi:starch synthase